MVKEFTKTIRKLQREFQREINKLELNNKKIQNEITRMVQKKEPRVNSNDKNRVYVIV
jgi:charged multivesicular body protein 2A